MEKKQKKPSNAKTGVRQNGMPETPAKPAVKKKAEGRFHGAVGSEKGRKRTGPGRHVFRAA